MNLPIFCCSEDKGLQPVQAPPQRQAAKDLSQVCWKDDTHPRSTRAIGVLIKDAFRQSQWREKFCHRQFILFVTVAQFSPQGSPNSQLWLHSCRRKCCSWNHVHDERMSSTQCQGGQFWMRRESTKSASGGEASAPIGLSCWVPKHQFEKKNTSQASYFMICWMPMSLLSITDVSEPGGAALVA